MTVECDIATLNRFTAPLFAPMTFPAYRRRALLAGEPAGPIACGATRDGRPIGLALVDRVAGVGSLLRSLYVQAERRGEGIGTALLAAAEAASLATGWDELRTVYTAGGAGIDAFERVLARRGWDPPARRTWVMRSTPEKLTEAFARVRMRPLDAATEIFPWRDLSEAEARDLVRRQRETGWPNLEVFPFHYGPRFEPETSVGLRHAGEVVGWVVNHRFDATTLRFTCSYLREERQGTGRLVQAYQRVVAAMPAAGFREVVWTVPVEFPRMVHFAEKRIGPFLTSLTETRGSTKRLAVIRGRD
jgi:GNAT superfamily N-acetyltransferase